jgi:methionyl-tRNA formyltransferase
MTIGFFGDGRWAHRSLNHIISSDALEVAFIVARHAQPDPALEAYAERLGVPFYTDPNVNRPEFIDTIRDHETDIHVSMSFDQILKAEIINLAPEGFINCHAGALPFYRGRNVLNWALINGERRFGVTVHDIDEGIDTGDIVLQRFGDITHEDDYGSLLDKAVELCAETLFEALLQIEEGRATRTPQAQIHPVGFYSSSRRKGDEWIDWTWSTRRIYNLIRAIAPPGPGARTLLECRPIAILRSEHIPEAPHYRDRPGTVVGRDDGGITVKTGDTTLRVTQVANLVDGAFEDKRTPSFRIGTTFGVNLMHEITRLRQRVVALETRLEDLT